jgi:hypothetical protein
MSADNGISVAYNTGKYEVRYWQGEGVGRARSVHDSALAAIVQAHALQRGERTEYGVSVTSNVINHARSELGRLLATED